MIPFATSNDSERRVRINAAAIFIEARHRATVEARLLADRDGPEREVLRPETRRPPDALRAIHLPTMVDPHFVEAYRNARPEDLPWYHPQPDADLVALLRDVLPEGGAQILDLGAGPAVHSIELAACGHHVVAIDAVPEARVMALGLAARRGVTIDYRVGDAIRQTPEGPFDLALDRGFLHTLDPSDRPQWRRAVVGALRVGGAVVVKCFDTRPVRDFGPPGLTARDVVDTLGDPAPGGLGLELLDRHGDPHCGVTVRCHRPL